MHRSFCSAPDGRSQLQDSDATLASNRREGGSSGNFAVGYSDRLRAAALAATAMLCIATVPGAVRSVAAEDSLQFKNAFDGSTLDVRPKAGEQLTPAVQAFHASGRNPYRDDPTALAAGKKLYETWCQSCHMPDGSGRMGPSLIGDSYTYEQVATDKGMFEVVFGGAGGAMQAFGKRMGQDDILQIIAYVRSLKRK